MYMCSLKIRLIKNTQERGQVLWWKPTGGILRQLWGVWLKSGSGEWARGGRGGQPDWMLWPREIEDLLIFKGIWYGCRASLCSSSGISHNPLSWIFAFPFQCIYASPLGDTHRKASMPPSHSSIFSHASDFSLSFSGYSDPVYAPLLTRPWEHPLLTFIEQIPTGTVGVLVLPLEASDTVVRYLVPPGMPSWLPTELHVCSLPFEDSVPAAQPSTSPTGKYSFRLPSGAPVHSLKRQWTTWPSLWGQSPAGLFSQSGVFVLDILNTLNPAFWRT